ncbi:MAG: phosphocholine cytidylyltransferase family protein [Nanoarchaeota archaeon]|nr:phosphocholine cytidylyltransferase family protein [Nanoarchaeota archaeon]MBU1005595.1 phosphocholine cytidylyltransferase family protein [Nanoarchaeota archaeon]MBU1945981.1 phosphocholine cytidylyltransferase family protein [Nanoarchaeota archaeon]
MKAMILASGVGSRMYPLTDEIPKCLIKLNGKTILGHELDHLWSVGIKRAIITTGPFEEKILEFMKKNYPKFNVEYVKNPKYEETNYIYSMFMAKDKIDDDILLMHSDMVFDRVLLKRLLKSKEKNAVLLNNEKEPPEKDFKGRVEDGILKEIGVDISGKNCFFLAPIYIFSKDAFLRWMQEIERFVKEGKTEVYSENAFNEISKEIRLKPVYFGNEFCMEIDTLEDLEIAKKKLAY